MKIFSRSEHCNHRIETPIHATKNTQLILETNNKSCSVLQLTRIDDYTQFHQFIYTSQIPLPVIFMQKPVVAACGIANLSSVDVYIE